MPLSRQATYLLLSCLLSLVYLITCRFSWPGIFKPSRNCRQERLSSVFTTTVCYMFCCMEQPVTCTSIVPSLSNKNPRSLNSSTWVPCPGWSKALFLWAGIMALNFEVLILSQLLHKAANQCAEGSCQNEPGIKTSSVKSSDETQRFLNQNPFRSWLF